MKTVTRKVNGLMNSPILMSGDTLLDRHAQRQLSQEIKDEGPLPYEIYYLSAPKLYPN